MTTTLGRFAVAALILIVCSGAAIGQGSFLQGYQRSQEFDQLQTLRNLQILQEAQRIQMLRQQQEALRQQQSQQEQEALRMQEQQRQSKSQEIQTAARSSFADRAKGSCIDMFVNNSSLRDAFTQRGVLIGQLCSCVEQEMLGMLTLDLTEKLLVAINESAGDPQKLESSPVAKEYGNRFTLAMNACVKQTPKGN